MYQFVDVNDVVNALEKASKVKGFDIYVIGADGILTLRELYQNVIKFAGSKSKIFSLPLSPALMILSLLDKINYSPLGVYQYTMMGRSIYADTKKIKNKLGWKPKKTNSDTFIENYKWYIQHKGNFVEIGGRKESPNRSVPKMGILKLVKMFS
jgi:nucleoside-diphosphate-sugar epimerase